MAATKAEYKGVEEDEKKPQFASEREVPFVVPHPNQLQSSPLNRCTMVTMATARLSRTADPGQPAASRGSCLASRKLDGETS